MTDNKEADWVLDLCIRCRLSIREARLQTRNRLNIVAGKNGCGKSQLLTIIHSHENTLRDQLLQDLGHQNYFLKEQSIVQITGPTRIHFVQAARVIACDREERKKGAYSFNELRGEFDVRDRYSKLRWSISRLGLDAETHEKPFVREIRRAVLVKLQGAFESLFPGRQLLVQVDKERSEVRVFGSSAGMHFVRPNDPRFSDSLWHPFATLSEGELNVLLLLFQTLFHTHSGGTRVLFMIDEIENHLRPETQSRFLRILAECIPSSAIVLATTHSPQVLCSVSPECRYLMVHSTDRDARGELYPNQLLPNDQVTDAARMLYELYGAESGQSAVALLSDVDSLSRGQAVSFAEECLARPDALETSKPWDPQRVFLSGLVQNVRQEGRCLEILDIGAGRGKQVTGLQEDFANTQDNWIRFDLVEPDEDKRTRLFRLQAAGHAGITVSRVLNTLRDLTADKQYDQVWLHNVLHEMEMPDFLCLLRTLPAILRDKGALNILEQAVLPAGEQGFFVYDPAELASLLAVIGFDTTYALRNSYSGISLYELTAHRKPHALMTEEEIVRSAVREAIQNTMHKSVRAIEEMPLRSKDPTKVAFLAFNITNGHLRLRALARMPENTVTQDEETEAKA